MPADDLPHVSLIVRSMDRPELAEALASAGAQTHEALDIIVVDATGGRHRGVASRCGMHPVSFVRGTVPRKRPVAANAGLDAASGDYVGLLDDDDALLPDHVARLVAALEAEPEIGLAFCRATEIREGGEVRGVGHSRVSLLTLIEQCFFPPCAALFRRSLLGACRFDESLDEAEDWDFWIQVAQRTSFRFIAQDTAIYRADRGRSAMSTGLSAAADRWREAVRSKWAPVRDALVREVDAAFERALACAGQGDHTAAVMHAATAIALYPFHAGALNLRGTLHAIRGEIEAARADFAEAVAADPDDPASLFNLAQAYQQLGKTGDAAALYCRVLAHDPAHAHASARLAALDSAPTSPTALPR